MTIPSNGGLQPSLPPEQPGSGVLSMTRALYWSLRREFWENRSLYVAPLAVSALVLFGFMISMFHLADKMRTASSLGAMNQQALVQQPYEVAEAVILAAMTIVSLFYCLDALHSERRDRSILFWKSLPVSDVTTVLAKAAIPILILPVLAFTVTLLTQLIMLLLTASLLGSGQGVSTLWTQAPGFTMSMGLLYHLVVVHGLFYAPFYSWMLLVSGWARRAVFLWAAMPVVAIGVVEKVAFNSSNFTGMLIYRLSGGTNAMAAPATGLAMKNNLMQLNYASLSSPSLWTGLALSAVFLTAAVRLRRSQGPI